MPIRATQDKMNQHSAAPEFAMSFTQEAVLLERRNDQGWHHLGEVRFAGREVAAGLTALREGVEGGPAGLDTVLVIPDDQILYTTLTVPVGSDTPAAIGRALEAITPYRAEDLAFDWCPSESGDIETLRVAAVARRTLDEAEEFCLAQGFRPAGFLSRPADTRFEGDPDFGPSRLVAEDTDRQSFSAPELSKARITAPVIDDHEPRPAEPSELGAASPVVSRIIAHHVAPPPAQEETAQVMADPEVATPQNPAGAAAPAVIRHGERKPDGDGAPRLSPRAAAVHSRAAEARARRAEQAAAGPEVAGLVERLRRFNPGRLPMMIGGLAVAVLIVLTLFGGRPAPQGVEPIEQETAAIAPVSPVEQAAPVGEEQPAAAGVAVDAAPAPAETLDPATGMVTDDSAATPDPSGAEDLADVERDAAGEAATAAAVDVTEPAAPEDVETARTEAEPTPPAETDALTRALAEALAGSDVSGNLVPAQGQADDVPAGNPSAAGATATSEAALATADAPRSTADRSTAAAVPARPAAQVTRDPALRSSARPPNAPVRTVAPAGPDRSPAVPANPLPYAQRTQSEPPRVSGVRPRPRPAATAPAAQSQQPAPAQVAPRPATADQPLGGSGRPPARPGSLTLLEEGSNSEDGQPTRLTAGEKAFLEGLLRELRTAQAGQAGLNEAERDILIRLADARPLRRPVAVTQPSDAAVRAAVAEAVAASDRPAPRSAVEAEAPVSSAGSAGLIRSARPLARPGARPTGSGGDPGPGNPSLSGSAVEDAIAAAVANSSALPGAVALTALSTSALPPRRTGAAPAAARPSAPTADELRAAAEAQQRDAALAEQRRMDAELQAQAEARARAQAAADAEAEARARAQAEARARAQAEAEARAAATSKQSYTPPEAENEPEIAASAAAGRAQGSAAASATVKDGITLSRTQIIGTIGAGKASRALVRLSNGRIITLRLGDRINGGTITAIGNSRITYVKAGRPQELSVLNGQ